jgi:hypothetical protein
LDEEWNKRYTIDSLIEELALLERHYRDGSYKECSCVPEKHLPLIAGLASEMVMFVTEDKLKNFYSNLGEVARKARIAIEDGDYSYLPHNPIKGLQEVDPRLEHKIKACVKVVEKRACPKGEKDYRKCEVNPVAVCQASVKAH